MMMNHAQCSTNKKCSCQDNYLAGNNARACKALIGRNCDEDADCYVENSICMDNALGKQCDEMENCSIILNSVCSSNGICICPQNYFAIGNHLCVPTINSDCTSDEECLSADSLYSCKEVTECSDPWHWNCAANGKCVCNVNNLAISNQTILPFLNGYCMKDDQCMAENSLCIDYRCRCKPNHVQAAGNLCVFQNEN
ncbi:hypothetical protein KQX54_004030 [Cotesia glomerata]|uniref:EB domain-containing protein n=1 Tax=Cotesia glomerata TaxID=32391 RepID=A0AAV7HWS0_COTGL|nr:hypothetical protein KQX54_004030 [Cotesia glomerata]